MKGGHGPTRTLIVSAWDTLHNYTWHSHTCTQTGDKEQAMAAFRGYLESRAADLATNQDLAAYFALPYVPDPAKHPSFKNLFLVSKLVTGRKTLIKQYSTSSLWDFSLQDSWTVELKARLIQFLKSTLPGPTNEPLLISLYLDVSQFAIENECSQECNWFIC